MSYCQESNEFALSSAPSFPRAGSSGSNCLPALFVGYRMLMRKAIDWREDLHQMLTVLSFDLGNPFYTFFGYIFLFFFFVHIFFCVYLYNTPVRHTGLEPPEYWCVHSSLCSLVFSDYFIDSDVTYWKRSTDYKNGGGANV